MNDDTTPDLAAHSLALLRAAYRAALKREERQEQRIQELEAQIGEHEAALEAIRRELGHVVR